MSRQAKQAKVARLYRDCYCLALYDCLDETRPLKAVDDHLQPTTLEDAIGTMRVYNKKACRRKRLSMLLGIFPKAMVLPREVDDA